MTHHSHHTHPHDQGGHAPASTPTHDHDHAEILDLDADVLAEHLAAVTAWLPVTAAPRHIVDLGCGTGAGTLALLTRFPEARVTAVDSSAAHLRRLREKAGAGGVAGRVRTLLADLDTHWPDLSGADLSGADLSGADLSGSDLSGADLSGADLSGPDPSGSGPARPEPDGTEPTGPDANRPDLVWASASLHHMADPRRTLRQVHDSLAPGGLFAVVELAGFPRFLPADAPEDRPGLEERCHAASERRHDSRLPHRGADWGPLLTAAGFEIEAERTIAVDIEASPSNAVGRYALSSLRRVRAAVDDHLSPEDLAALDRLLDTEGPHGILHRPDLAVRTLRTVWAARRV